MYKVIKRFYDLQDNNHQYEVGDKFPHERCGYPVSEERIAELASKANKLGEPLIKEIKTRKKKSE
jgi:hypothetical protein